MVVVLQRGPGFDYRPSAPSLMVSNKGRLVLAAEQGLRGFKARGFKGYLKDLKKEKEKKNLKSLFQYLSTKRNFCSLILIYTKL